MTGSESTRTRGRPIVAFLAVGWVALGFSAIGGGDTWRGAAGVALGVVFALTYLWPDSTFTTFVEKPVFTLRKRRDAVGTPDRG